MKIPTIEEARELPMETRMQMIETLLHSVALDAEAMSDAMDKLSVEGAATLALTLKDDFGLEFRHILKRLFWGSYELPHAKNFYFGLIPNKWLRQYQLAADIREQSQNPHTYTYVGSVTNEQSQNSTPDKVYAGEKLNHFKQ